MRDASDLRVVYQASIVALAAVSLSAPEGSVAATVDGAGKSTLSGGVSQNLRRHRGRGTGGGIRFDGEPLCETRPTLLNVLSDPYRPRWGRIRFGEIAPTLLRPACHRPPRHRARTRRSRCPGAGAFAAPV